MSKPDGKQLLKEVKQQSKQKENTDMKNLKNNSTVKTILTVLITLLAVAALAGAFLAGMTWQMRIDHEVKAQVKDVVSSIKVESKDQQ